MAPYEPLSPLIPYGLHQVALAQSTPEGVGLVPSVGVEALRAGRAPAPPLSPYQKPALSALTLDESRKLPVRAGGHVLALLGLRDFCTGSRAPNPFALCS